MSEIDELRYPEWQTPLQEVILEFDLENLQGKTLQAETSIVERLQELRQSTDSKDEKAAIRDGLSLLKSIKCERLGYPDWQ